MNSQEEALLISQLTAAVIAGEGQRALATGLESNVWSAAQRVRFAKALARIDFIAGMRRSTLSEWGAGSILLGSLPDLREAFFILPREKFNWVRLAGPLIPAGWFDQARASVSRAYMKDIIPSVDPAARRLNLTRLHQATEELIGENRGMFFGHILVGTFLPGYAKVAAKLAECQTQLDFARIAIALADWRETHGTYPATLAELPPEASLANHVHDLLTGQPFTYRPAADRASYRLYAFGPDGKDDGGERAAPDDRNPRDWVWSGGGH
jgi:hypothetical protein